MKSLNQILKLSVLTLCVTAFMPDTLPAQDKDEKAVDVSSHENEQTAEKRKEIIEEAQSALRETENALIALDGKDTKTALEALQRATGKLEILLAREPELALAPIHVATATQDLIAEAKEVKALVKQAEDALEDGQLQQARELVKLLASETVISTTHLPLATYPAAMKSAAALIDKGDVDGARIVLQAALNSLVVTKYIIPLPIVRAEALLLDAENLAENKKRTDEEDKKLKDLLDSARAQLELGEALGYGSKAQYKEAYGHIDEIEKKTKGKKSGRGFFKKIKGKTQGLIESSQPEKQ